MKLSKALIVVPVLSLLGAAAIGSGACSSSASGPVWTASVHSEPNATVETDACTALAACCTADEAGDLYCADTTSDCAVNFQYELNYGYCSDYTYSGFTVTDVAEPSTPTGGDSDDGGTPTDDAGGDTGVTDDGGSPDAESEDDASTPTDDASSPDDAGDTNPDDAGTPSVDAGTGTAPDAG